MARYWFGGTANDGVYTTYTLGSRQLLELARTTLRFYDAETDGTQYTDLLDADGNPVSSIVTGLGQVPRFQGPDGVAEMWADDGDNQRHRMAAIDVSAINGAVTAAETARDEAQTASTNAAAAVTTAAAEADRAEAAAATATAPTDSMVAGLIDTPGSSTRTGLDAAFVDHAPAATGTPATDRANLQAAITTAVAAGKRLRIPGGTYAIDATVTIPSGADIDFGGATVKRVGGVFDMLRNADTVSGNANITIRNLTIDGDKDTDGLIATNAVDRFGGLALTRVTDSLLENIGVTGTVNAEDTAGVYLDQCSDVVARGLNAWGNDRTGILLASSTRITIDGSLTRNNSGSGISSSASPECAFTNLVSHDNGYTNVSVNGLRSRVSDVLTYSAGYSGLNIGHLNDAADSVVTNVQSYGNTYEGITINSSRVQVTNFEVHGNARNGIRTMAGAVACRFTNGTVRNNVGGQGVYLESGAGHSVSHVEVSGNAQSGIYIATGAPSAQVGPGVRAYNNGAVVSGNTGGVLVVSATDCRLIGVEVFDDQATKTQESGIWLAGGSGHVLIGTRIGTNKTYALRETSSPKYVRFEGDGAAGAAKVTGSTFQVSAAQVGFYGATPVSKATNPGTATGTDAAVVNAIVTALRNLGLVT